MIRIFMPNGVSKKLKGKLRIVKETDRGRRESPGVFEGSGPKDGSRIFAVVYLQDGRVLKVDPLAMVFRGRKLVYSPRVQFWDALTESEREFLKQHREWGCYNGVGGRPHVRAVVSLDSTSAQRVWYERAAARRLAGEILNRG